MVMDGTQDAKSPLVNIEDASTAAGSLSTSASPVSSYQAPSNSEADRGTTEDTREAQLSAYLTGIVK